MHIRKATIADVPAITDIYNDAVLNTVATFDTESKTIENRTEWMKQHSDKYPVLVAEDQGHIIGYAAMNRWSDRAAYDDTAEASLYVRHGFRDRGSGKVLFEAILQAGKTGGLHCILARITQGNEASIHLAEKMGFRHVGLLKEVGRKFDRLLDVYMMQLIY